MANKKLYLCDPTKNTECPKTNCAYILNDDHFCKMTTNKKYRLCDK